MKPATAPPPAIGPAADLAPVGILLAAGRGSRYDPSGQQHKLLAALVRGSDRGLPVGFVAARRLRAALPRVVAAVRPGSLALIRLLQQAGCEVVETPAAERGMGASLAAVISATPSARGWVVALADMPSIAPATIVAIAAALDDAQRVVAPVYDGRRGHPVAFGAAHGSALRALDGDSGARALLQALPLTLLPTGDAGVLRDVDRPADL